MTIEYYCVGVKYDRKDSSIYETSAKYITTKFRDTVGGMMVNPDNTHFINYQSSDNSDIVKGTKPYIDNEVLSVFPEDNKKTIIKRIIGSDNIYVRTNNAYLIKALRGIAVYYIKNNKEDTQDSLLRNKNGSIIDWRISQSTQYYRYTMEKIPRGTRLSLNYDININFMSLFTNLLSPSIFHDGTIPKIKCVGEKISDWQRDYIMVFPFYSMDWMNRLYNEMEKIDNEKYHKNYWETIDIVLVQMDRITQAYVEADNSAQSGKASVYESEYSLTKPQPIQKYRKLKGTNTISKSEDMVINDKSSILDCIIGLVRDDRIISKGALDTNDQIIDESFGTDK